VTRGVTITVHQHVSNVERMLPLVHAGSGIGITVPSAAAGLRLRGRRIPLLHRPGPDAEYCLVWRHDTANAAVSELVDVVREL
jgi:DNA-binding transcriptional LysR family regulator